MKTALTFALVVGLSGMAGFAILRPRLEPTDQRHIHASQIVLPPCRATVPGDRIIRAKIVGWGATKNETIPGRTDLVQLTPVTLTTLEQVRGVSPTSLTVFVPGPFVEKTGEFLDGTLIPEQEAYVGIVDMDGRIVLRSQAFWPLQASDQSRMFRTKVGVLTEADLRAQLFGQSVCPEPVLPSLSSTMPSSPVDYSHVASDGGS